MPEPQKRESPLQQMLLTTVVLALLVGIGVAGFLLAPVMMGFFLKEEAVIAIGSYAFRSQCIVLPLILWLPEWIGLVGVEITQALSDGLTAIISIPFVFWYFRKGEEKRTKKQTSDGKRRL